MPESSTSLFPTKALIGFKLRQVLGNGPGQFPTCQAGLLPFVGTRLFTFPLVPMRGSRPLKRAWYGQHHHYSREHSVAYVTEACFKYNCRDLSDPFGAFLRGTVAA